MPANNIAQGQLNRIRAAINWTDPGLHDLNISAPYLGKEGIRMAFEGNATDYFPTMIGAVPSPVPYQICTVTVNLLKTQAFGANYQLRFTTNTIMGDMTIIP